MYDIIVKPYNMSKLLLEFPNRFGIAYEVKERFSFFADGYKWSPKYKQNIWDGKIYLFDIGKSLIQFGLVYDLIKWAKQMDYKIKLDETLYDVLSGGNVTYEKVYKFSTEFLKMPFEPYEYQIEAAVECINKGRLLLSSPTSSGKSYVIFLVLQWFKYVEKLERIVIIVPTVGLTTQMFNDFKEYSQNIEFNENEYLLIPNKQNIKRNDSLFTITTWQSLQNKSKGKGAAKTVQSSFFDDVDALVCDEVQNFKGETTGAMVQKSMNTPIKLGFSGTIANNKSDEMVLKGLFGNIFNTISIDDLDKKEIIAHAKIKCIECTYTKESINEMKQTASGKNVTYQEEIKYIITNKKRNQFISNLASAFKTNTLIIFNNLEQGELIKEELENSGKAGISIRNLHNVILASPTKSGIRILQTIGRVLRKNHNKDSANVIDIYDDLSNGNKTLNFALKHFLERYKIYNDNKFEVDVVQGPKI